MGNGQKVRTQVMIHGQHYTITGTEPTGHMEKVAKQVNDKMSEIRSINPYLDTSKLAVLTAVNAVHDLIKLKEQYDHLEQEFQRLKD
ncbi:cell division protein ZapA [Bacillus sp. FSL K6-3431]|uniref:cell division protein ZapA n=1 Tax=Bacillus sp. FSL K6-3431 TaxID=2921500 RepID=UPI0030FB2B6B